MNDNSLGGSGSSQNGGSMNYNHGNLQSSGNSNTHHNNHNSGGTLTTSFGSASGRDNHHQQQLQQQQLQQQYFQLQPITHTNNNPNEFLKNPNIFKRVYDELKQTPKPTHPIPPEFPLSKQNTAPIKLNLMDGHPPQVVCGAQLSIWHDTAGPGIEQFWSTGNENSMNLAPDFLTFIARQTLCGYDISMESEEMRFNIYPEQNEYDLASFTSELINVCTNFENVFSAGYPHVEISQTFFMESTIPSPQDLDFLIRAISSHIITSGSTVVVGSKHNEILKWLDTLYMFLTPNERYISSRQVNSHEMIPDLMIQGLLNVNQKQIEEKLPFSLRPTTVIDIDKKEVYHTDILHQYTSFREDFLIISSPSEYSTLTILKD
ncbi:hypothetical protein PPL_09619 [Heterostelium album PN500]|uniref:Uncharacterized protein n=1 Tax=Heterostelium pallidum (strain ATCC 26659 / Pp 5 / PN500) TaxID=670386 RepID=D3BNU8_HETP5|nr:hypothetical protein PPL_09619 [Heterostelium album PN500]EFA76867.1 hypothetical protein PPL_09619 [Heterostelium album PN500]|eukprot:XP_020428999.1 hypothetical protein PPL_09619 [Heterostelium album PN500]